MLGQNLENSLKNNAINFTSVNRKEYKNGKLVENNFSSKLKYTLKEFQPNVIINLIALTNIQACEDNPNNAYLSNTKVIKEIANNIKNYNTHLIQISTDQIYNGKGPNKEKNINPCNVYGITKYAGELIAQRLDATILRTNFVCKSSIKGRVSFSDWIVNSYKSNKNFTLYKDIIFSPLHAKYLCDLIIKISSKKIPGIFNLGAVNGISKANFALSLAKKLNLENKLVTIDSYLNHKNGVNRPLDMSLDINKFENTFKIKLPNIDDTLEQLSNDYKTNI